ncbi:hypothetical protein BDN72DRAFT_334076 [Pluteus cervinus]|uniref:Uncharacterized protein n=1 Tax=Pluteus cervinus TaxID=181527 RepID=A0ACD3B2S9_9AGAR|nr:hypothetical protein BDN72DRAFT_334076 [Pluteus cervinus]
MGCFCWSAVTGAFAAVFCSDVRIYEDGRKIKSHRAWQNLRTEWPCRRADNLLVVSLWRDLCQGWGSKGGYGGVEARFGGGSRSELEDAREADRTKETRDDEERRHTFWPLNAKNNLIFLNIVCYLRVSLWWRGVGNGEIKKMSANAGRRRRRG